jgi:predicted PurR-regulated permease PerM
MSEDHKPSRGHHALLAAAAFVIVIAGLKAASTLVVPLLLAIFIAVISAPLLGWVRDKGVPGPLAILAVILMVLVCGVGVIGIVGSSVTDFTANLDRYQGGIDTKLAQLRSWLDAKGLDAPENVLATSINTKSAMEFVGRTLSGLSGVFSNAFLILLIVVFILLEASSFPNKLRAMADGTVDTESRFNHILAEIRRYMALKTWFSLATGALVWGWLVILGVDYPLMWGMLAFLFNFVPNIGSIIAAVPAVILALVQLGLGSAGLTAAGYLAINTIIGNFVEPRFMGKGLGLSTLVVFLSLVFWGWVLGPVGMLLSVPLTMTVKIALDGSDDTRWIAILLGSDPASE